MMTAPSSPAFRRSARRGGIYFAVIGVSMLVALIGLAAMASVRAQRLATAGATDTVKARELARSAVELGVHWVLADSSWRTSNPNGPWATRSLADGALTIEGIDSLDGNLVNRPTDPLTVRGIGQRGSARQLLEVTMTASGPAIDALKMAVHTAGELRIRPGGSMTISGAPASTNSSLRNEGTINGDVECVTLTSMGTINGSLTIGAPVKPLPDEGIFSMYQNLGTPMAAPPVMINQLISPGKNPWGSTNPEGVYFINATADITIRNCRVLGTLVINTNGHSVVIDQPSLLEPYRKDYPALVVQGNLTLSMDSAQPLSESSTGINFNPVGTPYQGVTNNTSGDTFPAELCGLVHIRGSVNITQNTRIRGCLIAESSGGGAIDINANPEFVYDPSLQTTPIMGYMKSVTMTLVPASWKQVVTP